MKVRPSRTAFPASADRFRSLVEEEIEEFLSAVRGEMAVMGSGVPKLVNEIARVVGSGGKRLRPLFCIWGHWAAGGEPGRRIARAGAAIELLHTCAIIHDDLLDGSERRRGEPASHRFLDGHGGARGGRAAAVLAGDLAHVLSSRMLVRSGFPPEALISAFEPFDEMRMQAVGGEYLDLRSSCRAESWSPPSEADWARIAWLKSGSYTVVGPLQMGAALAGAGRELLEGLARYGRPLGVAFQLRDDLLGALGDPGVTGKDSDRDLHEGKHTALVANLWRMGTPRERWLVEHRLGRDDLKAEEIEELRAGMRSSGALSESLTAISSLSLEATDALASLRLPEDVQDALAAVADLVTLPDI